MHRLVTMAAKDLHVKADFKPNKRVSSELEWYGICLQRHG
jgi:hypothetical protein